MTTPHSMITLDEFIKKVPPGRSKITPFLAQIDELRSLGYSLAQIREFLLANDVQVSKSALAAFLRRRARASAGDAPAS